MRLVIILVGILNASAGFAQEDIQFTDMASQKCSEEAISDVERASCIGASAGLCIEKSNGQRIERALCTVAETKYWDDRLSAVYRALQLAYAEGDVDRAIDFSTPYPRGLAMQEMQRAWMEYRDLRCQFEAAQWGSMPSAGLMEVECLLRVTGEQALYLEVQPGDL